MSSSRILTCIVCPLGCRISVKTGDEGKIEEVTGNSCKRGVAYVESECTNPLRTITSTVRVKVNGSELKVVPVKTDKAVPKALIMDCMKEINLLRISTPVRCGDVLIENILKTGANVVATGSTH